MISLFKNLKDKIVIIVSHQEKIIKCANKVVVLDGNNIGEFDAQQAINKIRKMQCGRLGG